MSILENEDLTVLKRHHRALCHLRERKKSDRIAVFLGAGVSRDYGFPGWGELIDRIERAEEFDGLSKPGSGQSLEYRTQALIQLLKQSASSDNQVIDASDEQVAKHKWVSIVHRCLYENSVDDDKLENHPYLKSFLGLIKDSPLTINYNFDDCVERLLEKLYSEEQLQNKEKVYETVWEPSTQYQRSKGVIYHPNGFLPRKLIDGYSEQIVFAEGEFADQLIQTMHGHYSTLVSHLSRYTALLVGLSLNDPTLKHLLRQNTHLNPGHVHYWLKRCNELPSPEEMRVQQEINYEVYGVVILHLKDEEFQSFGRLLSCSDSVYAEAADRSGVPLQEVYYVTGAVGAGKSSVVSKLKSLSWLGEWIEPRPESLAKPHTELTPDERVQVDKWVSQQFRKKDFKIGDIREGVVICDRSPLDPLAFASRESQSERAKDHLEQLIPDRSSRKLFSGHVIFLSASGKELISRARHRHLDASELYLDDQQDILKQLYDVPNAGVSEVSTSGRTLVEVVRHVAKVIHLNDYSAYDIHAKLAGLTKGS